MSETGRYYIKYPNGRTFCVEPIHERDERATERAFTNGGTDMESVKNKSQVQGGSVSEDESIITSENGFKNISYTGKGVSPDSYIRDNLLNRSE